MADRDYLRQLPDEELIRRVKDDPHATETEIALAERLEEVLEDMPEPVDED